MNGSNLLKISQIGDEDRGYLLTMATPVLGTLTAFNPDVESVQTYLDRVELYFTANSVTAAKKVPALLTAIGPTTYTLLANLLAPDAPKEKSVDEIVSVLTKHF